MGGGGLVFEDVEDEAGEDAGGPGLSEGGFVDDFATGGVEEKGAGFELGEGLVVDEVEGGVGSIGDEGDMEGEDVGVGEEVIEGLVNGVAGLVEEGGIVEEGDETEGLGEVGDAASDVAGADDSDGIPGEGELVGIGVVKEGGDDVFGDAVGVASGSAGPGDALFFKP